MITRLMPMITHSYKVFLSPDGRICSLSNFQTYNTALLTVVAMQHMTPARLIYLIPGSLYLLTSFTQFETYFKLHSITLALIG